MKVRYPWGAVIDARTAYYKEFMGTRDAVEHGNYYLIYNMKIMVKWYFIQNWWHQFRPKRRKGRHLVKINGITNYIMVKPNTDTGQRYSSNPMVVDSEGSDSHLSPIPKKELSFNGKALCSNYVPILVK